MTPNIAVPQRAKDSIVRNTPKSFQRLSLASTCFVCSQEGISDVFEDVVYMLKCPSQLEDNQANAGVVD